MNVENQILGIIKIQGRITALGGEIGRANEAVGQADASVADADVERANFVDGRESARLVVRKAKEAVTEMEVAVRNAQKALKEAKPLVVKTEEGLATFTDELLIELNEVIIKRSDLLDEANAKVTSLGMELANSQVDLQVRQEALKEEGFEFNFVAPRPPKTTYL